MGYGGTSISIYSLPSFQQVDADNNVHRIPDFVGNVLQQLAGIGQANDVSLVIATNIDFPALRVSVAANPYQIFVLPLAFPFVFWLSGIFVTVLFFYVFPGFCTHILVLAPCAAKSGVGTLLINTF